MGQMQAIAEELRRLDVDDLLHVTIREDPSKMADRGTLQLVLRDHWGRETLRLPRRGCVVRPDPGEEAAVIPGQTSIAVGE